MSDMQMAAVESIARGEGDVVVLSPTGSGKTLAYLLPIVESIERLGDASLQCVVMVPSRELARQSYDYARRLTRTVSFYACHGGRSAMFEHRELREAKPQVIFSTPGRLNDHIAKGNIDVSAVQWLIIDEFDKCLEFGFHDEMSRAVGSLPKDALRVLLSATDAEAIPDFVDMANVEKIDFLADNDPLSTRINKFVVRSTTADKLESLGTLLRTFGRSRTIVYAGFRESVVRITDYLVSEGFVCASLHGGLEQEERNEAVYHFLNKSANILVSTNLSSRGLDLPDVDNIVHYHLPETQEDYIHRSGRTGRAGKKGTSISIIHSKEKYKIRNIEKEIGKEFVEGEIPQPQEICKKQLFRVMDQIVKTDVDDEEIAPFMQDINRYFEYIDKEEIIKKIVSREFGKFLAYYADAPEIEKPVKEERKKGERGKRSETDGRQQTDRQKRMNKAEKGFHRLFINLGKRDGFYPGELMKTLNRYVGGRQEVGHIDLLDTISYFEVPEKDARKVMTQLNGIRFHGRTVRCNSEEEGNNREAGRDNRHNAPKKSGKGSSPHENFAPREDFTPRDHSGKAPRYKKDDWKQLMKPVELRGPEPDFSEEGWARRKPKKK